MSNDIIERFDWAARLSSLLAIEELNHGEQVLADFFQAFTYGVGPGEGLNGQGGLVLGAMSQYAFFSFPISLR